MFDLSKTSNKKTGKVIELDLEDNFRKPPVCPKCQHPEFEGFSTGFGAYRRCLKCNNEWPLGGLSVMLNLSQPEKEQLREFHQGMAQDEAYNKAISLAEDIDRVEDVKMAEKLSGSGVNRSFWNDYIEQWNSDEWDY